MKGILHSVCTLSLAVSAIVTLSGCAGSEVKFGFVSYDQRYYNECLGPYRKFRPGDSECRYSREPISQPGQVQRVMKESEIDPASPMVISWCWRHRGNGESYCPAGSQLPE